MLSNHDDDCVDGLDNTDHADGVDAVIRVGYSDFTCIEDCSAGANKQSYYPLNRNSIGESCGNGDIEMF